jgi:hypothetical protein
LDRFTGHANQRHRIRRSYPRHYGLRCTIALLSAEAIALTILPCPSNSARLWTAPALWRFRDVATGQTSVASQEICCSHSKAAEDSRSPRRFAMAHRPNSSARLWTAPVPWRFHRSFFKSAFQSFQLSTPPLIFSALFLLYLLHSLQFPGTRRFILGKTDRVNVWISKEMQWKIANNRSTIAFRAAPALSTQTPLAASALPHKIETSLPRRLIASDQLERTGLPRRSLGGGGSLTFAEAEIPRKRAPRAEIRCKQVNLCDFGGFRPADFSTAALSI